MLHNADVVVLGENTVAGIALSGQGDRRNERHISQNSDDAVEDEAYGGIVARANTDVGIDAGVIASTLPLVGQDTFTSAATPDGWSTSEPISHTAPSDVTTIPTSVTVVLNDEDVLSGTGKFTNRHPGNQHFRQLCADLRPVSFRSLSKHAKRELAQVIVHSIEHDRGGRFLKGATKHNTRLDIDDDTNSSGWIELLPEEKIMRTLLVLRRPTAAEAMSAGDDFPATTAANEFSDTDVLSGTGKFTNRHTGNQYFRQLCLHSRPPFYRTLTKQAKRNLALSIIAAIEERPGRFLGQKATGNGQFAWVELALDEKITRTLLVLQRQDGTAETDESRLKTGVRVHDVLSGSGSFTNRHAGNQYFRQLCVEHRPKSYRSRSSQVKREVALKIIAAVEQREPPGRFLCQKDGPEWMELHNDEKVEKTLEALKYAGKRKTNSSAADNTKRLAV